MADFQLIISKANEILALANNAKNLQELEDEIVSSEGGVIIPKDENGNELSVRFTDDSSEIKTVIDNRVSEIKSNISDLETDIDELADDIKTELA